MKPLSPERRAAAQRKRQATVRRADAITVRVTTEERLEIEATAVSLGLASGASLLRMLYVRERARLARKAG